MFVNITGVYTHNRSRFDYLSEERLGYIEGTKGGIVKEQNNHSTINDFGYRMEFDYRPNSGITSVLAPIIYAICLCPRIIIRSMTVHRKMS